MEENLPSNPVLKHRSVSMKESRPTSSPAKCKNLFVQGKKPKKAGNVAMDIGFEYDHDVLSDDDFYRKIFDQNCYHPSYENLIDYYLEIRRMMESYDDQDRRNVGAIVGMTVLSLFGFFAFSFTIVGGIAGGVVGGTIGRYAGKKLRKKMKRKEPLTQEELYRIKIQCMIQLGKLQKNLLKHNLNKFRTLIEKIIEESTLGFRFSLFQNSEKMITTVLKLRTFLLSVQAQKALLLCYKLFKMHLKQLSWEDPRGVQEVADKLNRVLIPYAKLMEIDVRTDGKTLKKLTNLVTYRKIKNLMLKPEIIQILEKYPDPRTSPEYIEKFRAFLQEKVDIEAQIKENERSIPQIVAQLQNMNAEQVKDEVAKAKLETKVHDGIRFTDENLELEDMNEQSMRMQKDNIRALEIPKNKMLGDDLFLDNMLKQSIHPNKQTLSQVVHPKTPLSAHLECLSADQQDDESDEDVSSGDSSMKTDERGQDGAEEEKLEDDPALYVDMDRPAMSVSNGNKKNVTPPKIKLVKEEVIQEIMEGTSPTKRKSNRLVPAKTIQPISLNNLEFQGECHVNTNNAELMKMNTFTNIGEDNEAEENQKKKEEIKKQESGSRSPSKVMRDEMDAKFSEIVSAKQAQPKTKKEMVFEKILAIAYDEESKWEKVCQNPIILIHKIKPEDSPVLLLRAWAFLEGITPKEVFDHIYDTTARAQWDNVLADLQVVEKIDYDTEVIHFVIKTPFGITERDFVQKRQFQHDYPEKGTITMSFQSMVHPARPPTKNRIRAETHIAGYVIKPSAKDPNSTDMCILSQVDIKGSIPKVIVNMVSGRAPADWVNKLKKACEADRKKGKKC